MDVMCRVGPFVAAGLAGIGGGCLAWRWLREERVTRDPGRRTLDG